MRDGRDEFLDGRALKVGGEEERLEVPWAVAPVKDREVLDHLGVQDLQRGCKSMDEPGIKRYG